MRERGKSVTYIDKEKQIISRQAYEELMTNQQAQVFENKFLRVIRTFDGELVGPMIGSIPPEHWMPFHVLTYNRLDFGKPNERFVPDHDATKKFRTEKEAIDFYQSFLVRYGKCFGKLNEDGSVSDFIEHGNLLGHEAMAEKGAPVVQGGVAAAEYGLW